MKINKELIKLLIKKKSLKQKDVATEIDVSPQDFNNWMFRGIFPHYNKLKELANILEEDITGLIAEDDANDPTGFYGKKLCFSQEELIPYYETDPHFGLTSIWNGTSEITPKDYVYLPGLHADLVFCYYGRGMEPQLENGDWIVLRKVADLSFFNYGNLHVIATKEQVIVRNLKKGKNEQTVILSDLQESTDPIELPKESIKALFSVVTIIKRSII